MDGFEKINFLSKWKDISYVLLFCEDSCLIRILVKPDNYRLATEYILDSGFEHINKRTYLKRLHNLIIKLVLKLKRLTHPRENKFKNIKSYTLPTKIMSFQKDGLELIMLNHLAYISPLDKGYLITDQRLVELFFDNKTKINSSFYTLSKKELLVDMIAFHILDNFGDISSINKKKIFNLYNDLKNNRQFDDFKVNLEWIFFKTADVIIEKLDSGSLDHIIEDIYSFKNY